MFHHPARAVGSSAAAHQPGKLPNLSQQNLVPDHQGHAVDLPFQELLAKLRGGQITSVDALHAFQYRVGHLDAEESINIIFFLSHARLRRIVSSILPNQKNQPTLDWYLFSEIQNFPFSHSGIVSLYRAEPREPTESGSVSGLEIQNLCIGRNLVSWLENEKNTFILPLLHS